MTRTITLEDDEIEYLLHILIGELLRVRYKARYGRTITYSAKVRLRDKLLKKEEQLQRFSHKK
ncbi:MAG: hypothetical protein WBE34_18050 [Candidatus Nitrosopolaris sp.]